MLLCNVPDIRIKSRGMFITSADSFRLDFLTWLHIYAKWILLNGALNNSLPLILKDPQLLHLLFENAIEDDASVVRLLSLLLLLSTEERWLSLTQISMTPSKILFELFTVLNCNNDVSVMADYLVSEDTIHVFGVDGGFLGVFIALLKALKWETAGSPEKALILTTLERLSTKIKIMHHHQLFPYDPTPLIRRIEHALSK